jgi:hypothetical protein
MTAPRGPLLILLLLGACAAPKAAPAPPPPEPPPKPKPSLPEGFEAQGVPEVSDPFLPPDATWRWLVSELRIWQADARDLLVTFEEGDVRTTDRGGKCRIYRLPKGLRLVGVPVHVILKSDLSIGIVRDSGTEVVKDEEVTVVTARIDMGGGRVEEFRLIAKAEAGFRSISTGGEAG